MGMFRNKDNLKPDSTVYQDGADVSLPSSRSVSSSFFLPSLTHSLLFILCVLRVVFRTVSFFSSTYGGGEETFSSSPSVDSKFSPWV